jgi:hypothetical protein
MGEDSEMNANEMADLMIQFDSGRIYEHAEEIATMLRQQAKELTEAGGMIGVLREYISDLENGLDSSIKLNKAQAERNNEPVVWMSNGKEFYVQKNYCPDFIPLYTHPVKELTDEEIRTIQAICHLKNVGYDNFIMRFARAILRKAQEK